VEVISSSQFVTIFQELQEELYDWCRKLSWITEDNFVISSSKNISRSLMELKILVEKDL